MKITDARKLLAFELHYILQTAKNLLDNQYHNYMYIWNYIWIILRAPDKDQLPGHSWWLARDLMVQQSVQVTLQYPGVHTFLAFPATFANDDTPNRQVSK